MDTSHHDHKQYLNRKNFHIDCNPSIFSDGEFQILTSYGYWLDALFKGNIKPESKLQKRFILSSKGFIHPFSLFETTWLKYLNRHEIENAFLENERSYQSVKFNLSYADLFDHFNEDAGNHDLRRDDPGCNDKHLLN